MQVADTCDGGDGGSVGGDGGGADLATAVASVCVSAGRRTDGVTDGGS